MTPHDMAHNIDISITTEQLAQSICHSLTFADCVELVKLIDEKVADWDFTEDMATYFNEQLGFRVVD